MARPASESEPFRVPKAAELVARHLRRQIVRGELQLDHALPSEAALLEQFSVSRPTLREAFRILESEGLITVRRGARGGARVRLPSTEVAAHHAGLVLQHRGATLVDVLDARALIEPLAAGLVASRGDRKRSARALRAYVSATSVGGTDLRWYGRTYFEFNRLLVSLTRNETLILVTAMLEMISEAAFGLLEEFPPDRAAEHFARTQRARHALIDLIEAGDRPGAQALWSAHLAEAGKVLSRGRGTTVVDVLSGSAYPGRRAISG
jgi:DNA-binding FadR family transcriptional regulator